METLKKFTLDELKDQIEKKFFPRTLIISKDTDVFDNIIFDGLDKLNELTYKYRVYEFNISGNIVDLTQFPTDLGISIRKILKIISAKEYSNFFTLYRSILSEPYFSFNLLRDQNDFIDYILSEELYKQLNKKFQNRDLGYFLYGNKIILDQNFRGITKCTIFFYPKFEYNKIKKDTLSWELYDTEYTFLLDYLEALVSYREGRAQSEMSITGVDSNYDELLSNGKDAMEKIVDDFYDNMWYRVGKVW